MRSLELMCAVGLLAAASCRSAASIGDSSAARLVVTEDGREVAMRWLALTACDSSNSEFVLCFEPRDETGADHDYVPQCGAWEPTTYGGHAVAEDSRNHGWHHFAVVAAADVELIAAATGLEPARYVARAVDLEARCWLEKDEFRIGEGVRLNWAISNRASRTVSWLEPFSSNRSFGSCPCELWCDGDVVASQVSLGDGSPRRQQPLQGDLAAGETLENRESILRTAWLDKAGVYEVRATFVITVIDPEPRYSTEHACPAVRAHCDEFFEATLHFTLTR